ncbi:MAG: hypothetical protein APF76_08125 [Desulfitibacter sp. BRH_c19]|nr:MAG: hypothetical protein APF76_08125 [Desulfitibacter sp. BRH_c19]
MYSLLQSLYEIIPATIAYIFSLLVFLTGIVIFFEKRNPSQTVAWLLILLVFPVVGFVLYFFFGNNIRKRALFKRMKLDNGPIDCYQLIESQKERVTQKLVFCCDEFRDVKHKLINLLLNNSKTPFTYNNKSEVLTYGVDAFDSKIEAMENAKHHIHLEYFIVKDDNLGNKIKDLLIKKAKQGVKVRFIYDGLGGINLGKKFINDLKAAGVQIKAFLPIKVPFFSSEFNHRNHRKILVIDGTTGYLGGLNIGDEYINKNPNYPYWRDTHIKIQGEAVYIIQNVFLKNWRFLTGEEVEGKDYFPKQGKVGHELIQIVPSGPDYDWESIQQAYFSIITSAKNKIYVTTPYLIPDESITMALKTAALSGVEVKIIVPGIPDKKIVYYATTSYFEELIQAGVKIFVYKKGFIHAKVLTVDNTIASIGTANFDNRSFLYNFEINAFCFHSETVARLDLDFYNDLKECEQVTLAALENKTLWARFMESIARLASPLL